VVPVLNLAVPEGSPWHISTYTVTLLGKYLTYALLAVAVDLVWGYLGILSLGHGAFFALGGYAMGMYLMRQIGDRGVYGDPVLPDFMVFLNWKELPWFWHGFDMFWFAALMVVLVPGLLAFVFGWLAFRSRVTGVYLSIITQALTYALMLAFFRNEMGFGGNNGLTDFKDILGFDLQSDAPASGCSWPRRWPWRWAIWPAAGSSPPARARGGGHPRCGVAHPLHRLSGGPGQGRHLDLLGHARRCRRGAVRAAGRHHQPRRVLAAELHRAGGLGRRRRARDALRRGGRRHRRQLRQDLLHRRLPGGLAVRARRAVRAGDAVPAQGIAGCFGMLRRRAAGGRAWVRLRAQPKARQAPRGVPRHESDKHEARPAAPRPGLRLQRPAAGLAQFKESMRRTGQFDFMSLGQGPGTGRQPRPDPVHRRPQRQLRRLQGHQ
jgi:hypothetical protein